MYILLLLYLTSKCSKHSRTEGLFNLEMKKIKWRAYNRKAKGVEPGKYPQTDLNII